MKITRLFSEMCIISFITASCGHNNGVAWDNNAQLIPGKVQCELYDISGEGISYHDSDSMNNGSGKLNPANGDYFNEFRMHEGVDISFTKTGNIDDNPYNNVMPEMKQLYVGWTTPGEWINYTVNVEKAGKYSVNIMYTSNEGGTIEIVSDNKATTGEMVVPTTYNNADTIAWRQWHHWNKINSLGSIELKKGVQVITLKTVKKGNMNYDYLEFIKED